MLLDTLFAQYERDKEDIAARKKNSPAKILIAPSYHDGNILESCIDELIAQCCAPGRQVVVRPHPRFITHQPAKMQAIIAKYHGRSESELKFEMDFKSNSSIYESDIVISDWSSISYEFSFTTKKPCIIIDTPMKVINPEWRELGIEPADIWMRDGVGALVKMDALNTVDGIVSDMLAHPDKFADKIQALMDKSLYNPGHSGEVAVKYILETLINKKKGTKK